MQTMVFSNYEPCFDFSTPQSFAGTTICFRKLSDSSCVSPTKHLEIECLYKSANEYLRIVGLCNGLICLSDDYDKPTSTIIIWNPSARRSMTLPKPELPCSWRGVCLGFGFDALTNDYKVVRIVYEKSIADYCKYRVPPNVEIYTLSTGTWRSICGAGRYYVIHNFSPMPTLLNGAVHWVASERGNTGSLHNLIAAFDMSAEVVREITMPNDLTKMELLKLSISLMGTSLALVQYEGIWSSDYCWVWKMEEYGVVECWTRLFSIEMWRGGIREVVGFLNNKVKLFSKRKGLVSYHPKIHQMEYLGIHGTNRSFYVGSYVESLVLLKRENRVLLLEDFCDAVPGEKETQILKEEDRTEEQQ